ncbi:hypothetical protein PR003_g15390 [Phytophthora rubi]|uniref:Integrase catalytic domain-containing protein n=2 Tax=Phytophthora rubi TaxID=129364 RepID=A0A6A4F7J3_9STRA|nr:hypothetical protein PR003_g15390 [Phytophthora rubi]
MLSAALSPVEFSGEEMADVSAGHIALHDLSDGYLYTPVQDAEIATSVVQMQHASSLGWTSNFKEEFIKAYRTDPGFRDKYRSPHDPYILKDQLLYVQFTDDKEAKVMRLCVPRSPRNRLRTKNIEQFHDSSIAAHPGIRRTYLRIKQWYYWASLHEDVSDYVQSCETCTRWKHSNAKKNGKLIPIPIPKECWEVVSMDFVTGLPESDGYDAIMTVVDKLSKRPIYCPVHTTDDAEEIAHYFFDNVVRHHGVPAVIISDRDPKFTSRFWKSLAQVMGVQLNMTTSYRAQADGQTERQNLVLEDALRCMVSYHGDDWAAKLGTIEYAHATLVSASTGLSPFEVGTGRKERNPFGTFPTLSTTVQVQQGLSEYANRFKDERDKIIGKAKEHLLKAQASQKKYYDQHRSNVQFREGDLVMLDTRRIPLKHAAKDIDAKRAKLAARKVGPFVIKRMINDNAARLILPRIMKSLNPTFNVDVLSHYVSNPDKFETRVLPKASRIITNEDTGEDLHIVEKLLRKRQFNRKTEWLVKWHGLPDRESSWELEKDIKHVSHWKVLIDDFKCRQREVKPGRM